MKIPRPSWLSSPWTSGLGSREQGCCPVAPLPLAPPPRCFQKPARVTLPPPQLPVKPDLSHLAHLSEAPEACSAWVEVLWPPEALAPWEALWESWPTKGLYLQGETGPGRASSPQQHFLIRPSGPASST